MRRLRKRGEKLLHSKYVVIVVILLTITDCALVIAELILDLYSVKKTLSASEKQTFTFIQKIRDRYPDEVHPSETVSGIYNRLAHSTVLWNSSRDLEAILETQQQQQKEKQFYYSQERGPSNDIFTTSIPSAEAAKMGGDNSGNTAYSPKLLVDTVETPTTRIRRSIRGSFNNDDNRIFDFKDKKSSDYFVRNDSFDRILQQFVQVYQNSLLSSNESLKTANYHIVNDNDDDIYSENVDDNEDSDETSGDKPTSAYENNDTYIFALQQLSNYITMQIKSSIKKKYYDNNRDVETISSSSIDLSVSPQDSSPLISSSSSSSSLPLSSSSSSSFSSGDSVLPPSSPSFPTSSSSSSSQSSSSSSSQHLPLDSKNTDSSDFNLPDVSIHPSRYMSQGAASAHESDPTAGKKTNYGEEDMRKELHHSYEMEIAHKLHFASLCVVSILFIEVAMKIFCAGSHFLKRKIEVFDAVVIVTSVVVDLIFIKGLSEFAVDDSIFVLAFLLPWRVIRVVNSLVMAAIDHEHVKLRLLYSRKKKLDKTVENLRNEVDELKGLLQDIRQFCIKEGIEAATMDELLGKFAPRRRKDSKFYTLVKLVMSTASINNNNDNVSISSSSMENDLRDYACRDSIINETTSNENTFTSLRQYLSVPFRNDSQSTSDVESNDEGSPMSPCIYVTSPGSDDEGGGRAGEGMDGDDDNLDDCAFSFDTDEAMRRRERELMMKCSTSQDSHPRRHIRTVFDFDNKNKPAALSGTSKTCKIHKHDRDLCETSFICNEESCNAEGSIKEETIGAEGGTSPPLTHVDSFSFHQLDESPNQNAPATYRNRRFLSVPPLSVPRFHPMHQPTNSPTVLLSNASNNNNNIDVGDNSPLDFSSNLNQSLPPNTAFEMKRSASENVNALTLTTNYFNTNNNNNDNSYINNSPPENLDNVYFYRYDSPILHRKSVSSTPPSPLQSKRSSPWKISSRRNSATTERETQSLLKRSSSRRVRHFSGGDCMEAQSLSQHRRCQSERSRSHSPSPMNLLAVPGGKRSHGRREDKTSQFESKSMQDVSMAGNSHANNLSSDGKLLRSSCLSLNGERRKRRGKSPHRVSFKVS